MCHDLSHGIFLVIWILAFINADPRQARVSALAGCKHMASDPTVSLLLSSAAPTTYKLSSRERDGELVLLWRGASNSLGHQSWANRGQNMVSGGDLSSNCSSGATLGLISEVLKVGFYGVRHILKIFFSPYFFSNTEDIVVIFLFGSSTCYKHIN